MQKDRMIAVTMWIFCILVLAGRIAAGEKETYIPKLSDSEITVIGVVNFNGEEPLPKVCPRPYLCFSTTGSQFSAYSFTPFVEFSITQPYTIHLNEGWNLVSFPMEVNNAN
jgi:hypothetical protein